MAQQAIADKIHLFVSWALTSENAQLIFTNVVESASMFFSPVLSLFNPSDSISGWLRNVTASSLLCASALGATLTHATSVAEIHSLLEQGKTSEAAQLIQGALKQNDHDVQLRFLEGVVAAEQKKYDKAIQVFTALTQDYPGLPEPYNNLAVLHAAKGDERKAAQVLEQAIRTNPSYATAHENLGDLYARMASDAYAKALQLDNSRKAIQPKLALITQLFSAQAPSSHPVTTQASAATTVKAAVMETSNANSPRAAEPQLAENLNAPLTSAEASTPATISSPASTEAPKLAQTSSNPVTPTKVPDPEISAQREVSAAVSTWASAWAKQNMKAYYASYSDQFKPSNGASLADWKSERKERIVGKDAITVSVRDLRVNVNGNRATAVFRQHYAAGAFKATTIKTLHMQREGSKWLIVREETGG